MRAPAGVAGSGSSRSVASFGEGPNGELYVCGYGGREAD